MGGKNTFFIKRWISHWENTKINKNLLFLLLFCKSFVNGFEELTSILQSNLETYQFQQRKFWQKKYLLFYLNFTIFCNSI